MSLLRIYTFTGVVVAITAASSLAWLNGRKKTPEQREALRRLRIGGQGRITDGTVLDVREINSAAGHAAQMIHYSYQVAGVHYECAQDVTLLGQYFDLHSCRIDVTASVKYDPRHPGNSIVVAETWCGLRI
jgi:hypothetical protein